MSKTDSQVAANTRLLNKKTNRSKKGNGRLKAVERDLYSLSRREGLQDIGEMLHGDTIGWNRTIADAAKYLLETAGDLPKEGNDINDLLAKRLEGEHSFANYPEDERELFTDFEPAGKIVDSEVQQLLADQEIPSAMKGHGLLTAEEIAVLLEGYYGPGESGEKKPQGEPALSHQETIDGLTSSLFASEMPSYEVTTNWREEGQIYGLLSAEADIVNEFIHTWNKTKEPDDPLRLPPFEVKKPPEPALQEHKLELEIGQMAGSILFEGLCSMLR